MRNKKHLLWGILVTILLLFLGILPYLVGGFLKNGIEKNLALLTHSLSTVGELSTDYKQGYASSTIQFEFRPKSDPLAPPLKGHLTLCHLLLTGDLNIDQDKASDLYYFSGFEKRPELDLKLRLLPFEGLLIKSNIGDYSYHSDTRKMNFSGNAFDLSLLIDSHQFLRSLSLDLPQLKIVKDSEEHSLEELKVTWRVEGKRDLSQLGLNLSLKSYKNSVDSYGPGFADLFVSDFDLDAFSAIQEAFAGVAAGQNPQAGGNPLAMGGMGAIMQMIPRIIEKQPRLETKKCQLQSTQGNLDCYALVTVANAKDTNLLSLLTNLKVIFDFKAPESIFKIFLKRWELMQELKMAQMGKTSENIDPVKAEELVKVAEKKVEEGLDNSLNQFYEKKYFLKEGGRTTIRFQVEQGAMNLNGTPFIPHF